MRLPGFEAENSEGYARKPGRFNTGTKNTSEAARI